MTWTVERVAKLRRLAISKEDLTARQIGERIEKSRGAVITQCRKLGISLPNSKRPHKPVTAFSAALERKKIDPRPTVQQKKSRRQKNSFNFVRMSVEKTQQHGPLSINFDKTGSKAGAMPKETVTVSAPIYFPTRGNLCGWVIGDPRALMCCGAETGGRYYCPPHVAAAYPHGSAS